MKYNHLFGPVLSRRLGISEGIDLVPFKTCSLNCVYCECGGTNNLTLERKEYVPVKKVKEELKDFLKSRPNLDYITFSGSGEPTLHNKLGEIVKFLKKNYPDYKIALLTNGTLFYKYQELYKEVKNIDLIIPSLDAVSEKIFCEINRGNENLNNQEIISGLIKLREKYEGNIWLEIFILPGVNDSIEEINKFNNIIKKIKPDKVQLNSLDRPGTEKNLEKADYNMLKKISKKLSAKTEIVTGLKKNKDNVGNFRLNLKNKIIETLKRRPCTKKELAHLLGTEKGDINQLINNLIRENQIKHKKGTRGNFYYIENNNE